jgi:hypothetical protein
MYIAFVLAATRLDVDCCVFAMRLVYSMSWVVDCCVWYSISWLVDWCIVGMKVGG